MSIQRILFVYLKTGGGHLSAAKAVATNIRNRYEEDIDIHLLNPVPERNQFAKYALESGYRVTSNWFPRIWIFLYEISKLRPFQRFYNFLMYLFTTKVLINYIKKHSITKIVIFHFLLNDPVYYTIRKVQQKIPSLIIVTDPFTAHPLWFYNPSFPLVVFTEQTYNEAIRKHNYSPAKVKQLPIILREEFNHPYTEEKIREKRIAYGCTHDKPVVLIAGGGEGLPKAFAITKHFLNAHFEGELIIVCGHDRDTRERIRRLVKRYPHTPVKVYGYVDFMFDLMNIADIVVTKAGPATIMEALMLKKPLIITSYLYGQERGNVDFVVNNRVGFYTEHPREVVSTVNWLISDPEIFNNYQRRIEQLELTIGTSAVASYIVTF